MLILIGVPGIFRIPQQRQYLAFELLVGRCGVDQRHTLAAVHQIPRFLIFERRIGSQLEQHVAVMVGDMGQRRYHRHLFLLGEANHRSESLFVDRADNQVRFAERLVPLDDLADAGRIAGRVVEMDVHRDALPDLNAVNPQQETLVELQVVAVGLAARSNGQQQRHIERLAAAQGPEFDRNGLRFRSDHAVPVQAVGNFRRHGAVQLRDFDHRSALRSRVSARR